MVYVDIVNQFIYAERTSNWELHLSSISKMLNLFAATGHSNYAKSERLSLQTMEKLIKGYHIIRITNKNWTGI